MPTELAGTVDLDGAPPVQGGGIDAGALESAPWQRRSDRALWEQHFRVISCSSNATRHGRRAPRG